MPFKFRLKRTRRYEVRSKHLYVVCVQLLDQTLIECTLSADSTGRECIENIAQRIELKETQYFGLRYFNKSLQLHWLDLDRPVKKQVEKHDYCPQLYMGVQLYVSDITRIQDDMARYQYYLQLKHDILEGQLPCSSRQAVVLASYAIQAEFGDHDYSRHNPDFFKEYPLLPRSMMNNDLVYGTLMQQVMSEHQQRQNLSPALAELQYVMAASQMDGYGVECYPAKNENGADLIIGVSLAGLVLKLRSQQGSQEQPPKHFRWDDIQHLTHSKKIFSIQTTEKKTTDLHMDDYDVARYVWRMCVTQHTFYRSQKAYGDSSRKSSVTSPSDLVREPSLAHIPSAQPPSLEHQSSIDSDQSSVRPSPVAVRSEIIVHHVSKSSPNLHIQYSESSPIHQVGKQHHVNASVYSVHDAQVVLGSHERIIPPYRPSPDYDTVMQHRHFYQVRHPTDSLVHSQSIQQCNIENLSQSGVYTKEDFQQTPLHYSQPDVHYSCVQNNHGYIAYSHPVTLNNTRPVERVSSLIIQPTYSTPDLTAVHQGEAMCDYRYIAASETMINHTSHMAQYGAYRHPPAYYRTSSSTPDLARAPDTAMISGRNVDLSSFITRQEAGNSLEHVDERHERRSSCSSDRTFHAHDESVFTEPEPDYSDESLEALDDKNSPTLRKGKNPKLNRSLERLDNADADDEEVVEEVEDGMERLLKYQHDVHLVDYVVEESRRVEEQERLNSQSSTEEKREEEEEERVVKKRGKRQEREDSFTDSVSQTSPSSELRLAAENGLSISRAQLLFNENDESRAPKDERRKVLEKKLEDGTVESEFERIPRKVTTADCSIALMTENLSRNRYKDIQPYDSSRVRLKPKQDNPMGYINASHVRVRVKNQELWYLAAQGPLDNTVEDFWSMVWEQDVQVVAMLTEVKEYGSSKCAQYWPKSPGSKHRMTHGDFVITLQFRNDSGCFVTSGLNLRNKAEGRERTVWHLQFTDWPDHGCPDDVHGFLAFLEEMESVQRHIMMESQDTKVLPILVHCTAGVGRSGVAILVEVMKACLEYNQNVDVPTVLATLRGQRMHMVQMQVQYAFVYKTLIQYLKNARLI